MFGLKNSKTFALSPDEHSEDICLEEEGEEISFLKFPYYFFYGFLNFTLYPNLFMFQMMPAKVLNGNVVIGRKQKVDFLLFEVCTYIMEKFKFGVLLYAFVVE